MKNIIGRFILILAFVFTIVNICFSNDIDLDCSHHESSVISSLTDMPLTPNPECDLEDCGRCSFCHDFFINIVSNKLSLPLLSDSQLQYDHKILSYPKIYFLQKNLEDYMFYNKEIYEI
jgi:hypothetical protein